MFKTHSWVPLMQWAMSCIISLGLPSASWELQRLILTCTATQTLSLWNKKEGRHSLLNSVEEAALLLQEKKVKHMDTNCAGSFGPRVRAWALTWFYRTVQIQLLYTIPHILARFKEMRMPKIGKQLNSTLRSVKPETVAKRSKAEQPMKLAVCQTTKKLHLF